MASLSPSLAFESCAGFIQFTCFDAASKQTLVLGGLGHVSVDENNAAWSNLPAFDGTSSFQAMKLDASRNCVETRQLSAQACEELLRRPIASLRQTGKPYLHWRRQVSSVERTLPCP